jgi:hypothetical protein
MGGLMDPMMVRGADIYNLLLDPSSAVLNHLVLTVHMEYSFSVRPTRIRVEN